MIIKCAAEYSHRSDRLRSKAIFLLFIMFIGPAMWKPGTIVSAAPTSYELYGSSMYGWGFTNQTMTIPGPDLTVRQGETVVLNLTAVIEPPFNVTLVHDFGVDYDFDGIPSAGEPYSGFFGGGGPNPDTITYSFSADAAPGVYTYYCYVHRSIMFGRFIIDLGLPPTASFSYTPASPSAGQTVTFDASNSSDPDGTIEGYSWLFGDGGSGSGVTVQHTYLTPGEYNAALTVRDITGLTNTTARSIIIAGPGNHAPTANFAFTPLQPILGQRVDFDASSSLDPDPGDRVVSYSWDFGDGTTLTDQAQPQASHIYRTYGTLQVSLVVKDSNGAPNQGTVPVNVLPVRDIAVTSLALTPQSVKLGQHATIDVTLDNLGNVTEVFQIQLKWNMTEITSWSATVTAAERLDKSYNWTAPSPGIYIISAKVLVSSADQNPQDNEKTSLFTVVVQTGTQGLPLNIFWFLLGTAAAVAGLALYFFRRRRKATATL